MLGREHALCQYVSSSKCATLQPPELISVGTDLLNNNVRSDPMVEEELREFPMT